MNQKKRIVFAFVDSQNLNLGVRSQGWILDFKRFRVFLQHKYDVKTAYLFIGYVPGNESLYTHLQEDGYIVVFKPTLEVRRDDGTIYIKGNVDAELVLHTMIEYPNYDAAIIVSGDGDFRCLIKYLDEKEKLLRIIVPNRKYSSLLSDFARYIVNIALLRQKLERRK